MKTVSLRFMNYIEKEQLLHDITKYTKLKVLKYVKNFNKDKFRDESLKLFCLKLKFLYIYIYIS